MVILKIQTMYITADSSVSIKYEQIKHAVYVNILNMNLNCIYISIKAEFCLIELQTLIIK